MPYFEKADMETFDKIFIILIYALLGIAGISLGMSYADPLTKPAYLILLSIAVTGLLLLLCWFLADLKARPDR